jgi:cytidylate kinase
LAQGLSLQFSPLSEEGTQHLHVNGTDVTAAIRTPEVSSLTSRISAVPDVRRVVVEQQRRMGDTAEKGVVLEGRDIGTVVFPQAQLKIFLTASPEERARRRTEELLARGVTVEYTAILQDQIERDLRDSSRADSPLAAAPDAVRVNTDGLPLPEVVERILTLYHQARSQ